MTLIYIVFLHSPSEHAETLNNSKGACTVDEDIDLGDETLADQVITDLDTHTCTEQSSASDVDLKREISMDHVSPNKAMPHPDFDEDVTNTESPSAIVDQGDLEEHDASLSMTTPDVTITKTTVDEQK